LPFGTPIAKSPTSFKAPSVYFAPGTPPHPFDGPLPLFDNSTNVNQNDTGITKFQYTHALSQSAYLRAYAYTFFSDWFTTDPTSAGTFQQAASYPGIADYELTSHTSGGAIAFEDQVNSQNLVSFQGNYTTGFRFFSATIPFSAHRSATWRRAEAVTRATTHPRGLRKPASRALITTRPRLRRMERTAAKSTVRRASFNRPGSAVP
jgi:hypothetical protein